MKTLFTLLTAALFGSTLFAQGVITRIGAADGTKFYYDGVADLQRVFDEAALSYDASQRADTILFSGGTFNLTSGLQITSRVVMIGSGIRSDSSTVYGGKTEFIGYDGIVTLGINADGTEIHGIDFNMSGNWGAVRLGINQADSDVDNVKFYRCSFNKLWLGPGTSSNGYDYTMANDVLVEQCVVGSLVAAYCTRALVRNSFIGELVNAGEVSNVHVKNCILLGFNGRLSNQNHGVLFESNIFLTNASSLNVTEDGIFTHNLFVGNAPTLFNVTFAPGIQETGTEKAVNLGAAFTNVPNVPSPIGYTTYQFNGNYTLVPAIPLGNDGTPRGIYGGEAPWKDGSLPFNPHWTLLDTRGNTTNGLLRDVRIKASAQQD